MKYIILDRDGVINADADTYIKHVNEWKPIPGSLEAIAKLSQAGYRIAIATNQSGINRGLFGMQELDEMHQMLQTRVRELSGYIDGIFFCPHQPSDECDCRKPKTGLFKLIANFFQVNLSGVLAVGDAWRDIQAASAMHCQPVLVRTGKGEHTLQLHQADLQNVPVYNNLAEVAELLIKNSIV
jgi:D-glycero-D-manno-heptose 1,7-bisphosphate phosphatase